jgi:hypothetical protein
MEKQNEPETPLIGVISEKIAKIMIAEAAKPRTSGSTSKPPITHCVWFSLEEINLMAVALNAEKSAGFGTDGLRVYLGRYTKETDPPTTDHIGRDTVLFVSTKKHSDGISHQDYFEHIIPEKQHMSPMNRGQLCEPASACTGSQFEA